MSASIYSVLLTIMSIRRLLLVLTVSNICFITISCVVGQTSIHTNTQSSHLLIQSYGHYAILVLNLYSLLYTLLD